MLVSGPGQRLLETTLQTAAAPVSSIAQGNARELCWLRPAHNNEKIAINDQWSSINVKLLVIKKNQKSISAASSQITMIRSIWPTETKFRTCSGSFLLGDIWNDPRTSFTTRTRQLTPRNDHSIDSILMIFSSLGLACSSVCEDINAKKLSC